jgi:hypothetical protein
MVELTLLDGVVASSLLLTLGYIGATYLQSSKGRAKHIVVGDPPLRAFFS